MPYTLLYGNFIAFFMKDYGGCRTAVDFFQHPCLHSSSVMTAEIFANVLSDDRISDLCCTLDNDTGKIIVHCVNAKVIHNFHQFNRLFLGLSCKLRSLI